MPNSLCEHFVGIDWERYSKICNKLTPVICVLSGVMSLSFGFSFYIGLWSIFIGIVIATFEFQALALHIPSLQRACTTFGESIICRNKMVKALVYAVASLLCYLDDTVCIAAGLMLDVNGLLLMFAAVNNHSDYIDITAAGGMRDSNPTEFGI